MSSRDNQDAPRKEHLEQARLRIAPYVHRTPVFTSSYFDHRLGAKVFFKCENFQKVGAFKIRGATNAVFSLEEAEIERGVVAHSSGNHAQALALAARTRGAHAIIVMPRTAPAVKLAAVRDYGAEIRLCEPTLAAREAETAKVMEETGAVLVHPSDDSRIIAGQASAASELFEEEPNLDLLLGPVGGGGLLSGIALAAHFQSSSTQVIAGEPAGADDAYRSLQAGELIPSVQPKSIADGLLSSLSPLTFSILKQHVAEVVPVSEEGIVEAMKTVWERMKILIEPSAAVPVAALLGGKLTVSGKRVGVILSGGNVDLENLPWSQS
ncbi:MAG: pyridoxal-phosphate dependent enzyme [Deltaproteobacteria bacterium]|nr:pyridoxal-phosphate dependent enzyme [Deltaproteobacteria bacterium]